MLCMAVFLVSQKGPSCTKNDRLIWQSVYIWHLCQSPRVSYYPGSPLTAEQRLWMAKETAGQMEGRCHFVATRMWTCKRFQHQRKWPIITEKKTMPRSTLHILVLVLFYWAKKWYYCLVLHSWYFSESWAEMKRMYSVAHPLIHPILLCFVNSQFFVSCKGLLEQ